MPSYTFTEPHPTVPQNSFTHSGRGGAGNFFRAPATTAPQGIPTTTTTKASTGRFYSGRGGAGNAHAASARPVLSFDDDFARLEVRESNNVVHVGRGGAGNIFANKTDGEELSRRDSHSTTGSASSGSNGFWNRLSTSISRH
jgi:hypothetical protein